MARKSLASALDAGLAVACTVLGHPLVVAMSAGNSPQRARMLEALGAEVELAPGRLPANAVAVTVLCDTGLKY